jgi:hypothetical protein
MVRIIPLRINILQQPTWTFNPVHPDQVKARCRHFMASRLRVMKKGIREVLWCAGRVAMAAVLQVLRNDRRES